MGHEAIDSLSEADRAALERIRGLQAALTAQTVEWARINTGSWNAAGLKALAPEIARRFGALEAEVRLRPLEPFEIVSARGEAEHVETGPLIAVSARQDAPVQIVMTGHYDTVFPPGTFENITEPEPGRLNGPGLTDMKGGLGVMCAALEVFEAGPLKEKLGYRIAITPDEEIGNPASADALREAARTQHELPGRNADRVVGVFIGWRGDTSDLPLLDQTTFWDRRRAAERVVSLQMRETMYRIMETASERPSSKCFVFGHSMGGLIVGRTLAPTVTALLLDGGERGVRLPADLVLLENPALDGLAAWQLLDFLKRTGARAELRMPDGTVEPAEGPVIVSITSEADTALGVAYGFGQTLGNLFTAFRGDHRPGRPSQRALATTAHGLVDELVSHRARMVDGELVLERVPGAWNDTPFWVIRVDREISSGHGDIRNPRYGALIERLFRLNRGYQTGVKTWLRTDSDPAAAEPGT